MSPGNRSPALPRLPGVPVFRSSPTTLAFVARSHGSWLLLSCIFRRMSQCNTGHLSWTGKSHLLAQSTLGLLVFGATPRPLCLKSLSGPLPVSHRSRQVVFHDGPCHDTLNACLKWVDKRFPWHNQKRSGLVFPGSGTVSTLGDWMKDPTSVTPCVLHTPACSSSPRSVRRKQR